MSRLELDCETHEITSFDGTPAITFVRAGEWSKRARGARRIETVARLDLSRRESKLFAPFQRVRIVVEVLGPIDDDELDARDRWQREFEAET